MNMAYYDYDYEMVLLLMIDYVPFEQTKIFTQIISEQFTSIF